jgi:hypothetical protein
MRGSAAQKSKCNRQPAKLNNDLPFTPESFSARVKCCDPLRKFACSRTNVPKFEQALGFVSPIADIGTNVVPNPVRLYRIILRYKPSSLKMM